MANFDLEKMSFDELVSNYLLVKEQNPENTGELTQYLNQMVNIGPLDEKGWVGVCIHHLELKTFAIEVMKLHAMNHLTNYYEWMMLATFLPPEDPFRTEVIESIRAIDSQK